MQVSKIKNEGLEIHYKIQVPPEAFNDKVRFKLEKIAPTVKLPGFRPGKVPFSMIEQRYKPAAIKEEIDDAIQSNIESIIKQNNIKLASEARIENLLVQEDKGLEFTVVLEMMPEIEQIDLSAVEIEKPVVKITEELIEEKINQILASNPVFTKAPKTYKAQKGDKVIIDFEGFLDGEAFEGGKAEKHELVLGSGSFIPGFEEQLEKVKAGQDVSVNVTFPEKYHSTKLAGKLSEFKVFVHEVQKPEKMVLTDETAKLFQAEDKKTMEQKVKAIISYGYEETSNTQAKLHLFDKLEVMLNFDVPKSLLESEKKHLLSEIQNSKEEDSEFSAKSSEEIDEYCTKIALRRVRIGLMLAHYAEKTNIKVTHDDHLQEIKKQIMRMPSLEEQIINHYKNNPNAMKALTGSILEEKAVMHILSNSVKLKEVEYTPEEYNKMLDA